MRIIGSRLPQLIQVTFFGCIGLLLIGQIVHLYQQYTLGEVKVETFYDDNSLIEMPNLTLCFKLVHVLNISLLFEKFSDVLLIVKNISKTDKDYTEMNYQEIIMEQDNILFDKLTTSQFFATIQPIEQLFKFSWIRTEKSPDNYTPNWLRRIYSKKLCLTFRSNLVFDYKFLVFGSYGNSPLAYFKINLTSLPFIRQVLVFAHHSDELPWFHQINFASLKVYEDTEHGYALSFHKHVDINLPGSTLNGCNQQPLNPFKDVPNCYEHCLIAPFVDRVQKYPRDFLVKSGDDFKLIDNYWERVNHSSLITKLYRRCKKICGLRDCVEITYKLNNLSPTKLSKIPGKIITIVILPSSRVTTIYARKPVITFSNLISSIGGLIGLWFGSSFYSLIKLLSRFELTKSVESRNKKINKNSKDRLFHRRKVTPAVAMTYKPVDIEYIPRTYYLTRVNLL